MQTDEYSWLTGRVLRAARVLTGFSAAEIAKAAGVGEATIKRAEATDGQLRLTRANVTAVVAAYVAIGVQISVEPDEAIVIRFGTKIESASLHAS